MLQDGKYTFEDKRNWVEYNEKLVKRGEFYISLDFIEDWENELEKLNRHKIGRPFEYPHSFIYFSAIIHEIFYLPYRQLEGFFRKLSGYIVGLQAADYTTLFKRIARIEMKIENKDLSEDIILALDSSGLKVTNRGDWIRKKWKVYRGWIKVHIGVDVKSKKLLAIDITDESVSDNRRFKTVLEQAEMNANNSNITRVLADGAYDTRDDFNLLEEKQIEAGIKTRKNANTKGRGSLYRGKCVWELRKIGYDAWKEKYQYGQRWASECYLSAFKRIFGESINAKSRKGVFKEVIRKFCIYNILLNL